MFAFKYIKELFVIFIDTLTLRMVGSKVNIRHLNYMHIRD